MVAIVKSIVSPTFPQLQMTIGNILAMTEV